MAEPVATRPALVEGARASRTSIWLKILTAASGLVFVAFVLGHMYGNLKAFSGHDAFNEYAAPPARGFGEPMLPHEGFLWIMRAGLLIALIVHVACVHRADPAAPGGRGR